MPSRVNRENLIVRPEDFSVYDIATYAHDLLRHNGNADLATGRVTAAWQSDTFDHAYLTSKTLDNPLPQFTLTGMEHDMQRRNYVFGKGTARIAVYDPHDPLDQVTADEARRQAAQAITSHPFRWPNAVRNTRETEQRYREILASTAVQAAIEDGQIDIDELASTHDLSRYKAAAKVVNEYGFHIDGSDIRFSQSPKDTNYAILSFAARAFYDRASRRAITPKRRVPPTI